MPRTKTGKEVMSSMKKQYGEKKGEEVFYASIVKGKPGSGAWEKPGKGSKPAKAKTTHKRRMVKS